MIKRPSSEYALLGALMTGPRHGYEVNRFLGETLLSTWQISTSQLYTLLKRLEKDGFLVSAIEAQDTRPSKRVFSITQEGETAFLEWVHSPAVHARDLRVEFLAKLFFFEHLSLKGADKLISAQTQSLESARNRLFHQRKDEKDPYRDLVGSFKLATLEAWLSWLENEAAPYSQMRCNPDGI